MKPVSVFLILLVSLQFSCEQQANKQTDHEAAFVPPVNTKRIRLFDEGWRFSKTEKEEALSADFDDSSWRMITLPHDWSIEDLPEGDGIIGPFSKESPGGVSTGFTVGGTGIYRKTFTTSKEDSGKIFTICFDGVYMESDVWINGHHLGFHPNGYTPFYYELTDYLNAPGKENVLVLRAKNEGQNSRWYSGSGIYRHVWLRVTDPLNIPVWGVFVKTVLIHDDHAEIEAEISVQNQENKATPFLVRCEIPETNGNTKIEFPGQIEHGGTRFISKKILHIKNPELWSTEHPKLYTLRTEIEKDGKVVDVDEVRFGIRTMEFSPEKGFLLNGKPVILKGGCMHHDNGILGSATFDRAEQRRVELMKANGFNAIRTSHNPPSQQFLDACDRLGMLVMDEAFDQWEHPKNPNDYHRFFREWSKKDIQNMILRDRNHPSVFAWSYGNEIYERADSSGIRIAKELISAVRELDTTRPVTQAICGFWEYPDNRPWSDTEPAFALMDIHSYNYQWRMYETDHAKFPGRIMVGTETFPLEAYENYKMAVDKSYVIGDFVWTGMDYLGEAGIGQASLDSVKMAYPWFNGYCGDISILGFKKPQSFYRDVVWGRSELEMAVETPAPPGRKWVISRWGWRNELPSWNWKGYENRQLDVYAYSPANKVALFLNDEKVEEKTATDSSNYVFHFKVPYSPGELTAIAYDGERELTRKSLKTTGKASRIRLKADRSGISADPNDLAYVEVTLTDDKGLPVSDDDRMIHFETGGKASLVAVGNDNPTEMKSFQTDSCRTFQGRCLVIIRGTIVPGKFELKAEADGLTSAVTGIILTRPAPIH